MTNKLAPCELWLIRHGETDWNLAQRMQGRTDIPLNATGTAQAQGLVPLIAKAHSQLPFTAIYATPLSRAAQTAMPLAHALGLTVGVEPGLQERAFGVIEGQPYSTVREGIGATPELTQVAQAMHQRLLDYLPPTGQSGSSETLRQFYTRSTQAVHALAERHPGERIVAISHGGVLDCIWRWANGVAIDAPRTWSIVNASVNVLRVSNSPSKASTILAWGVQASGSAALDELL